MRDEMMVPMDAPVAKDIPAEILAAAMERFFSPLVKMIEHNTRAMEQVAAAQKVQNDRMEALERQIRLGTPVTAQQVKYINEAIRARAAAVLEKYGVGDPASVRKLSGIIRRSAQAHYGVAGLREIPRHEYSVALSMVGMWNDVKSVMAIVSARAGENEREAGS